MKLVILGASGGIGRLLVEQAHARGHDVRAAARPSSAVTAPSGVDVRKGDLESESFLRECVRDREVVLSALGLRLSGIAPWAKAERPNFLRDSTDAIIAAMKAEGVRRVCAVSSGGVGDSREILPPFFKAFVAASALRTAFVELDAMEQRFFASGLEVCMVRPSGLTDEPATGKTVVTKKFTGRATIARADVAAFMLDQAEKSAFSERAPVITVTGG
jgi:putative NADH-flavin reductase